MTITEADIKQFNRASRRLYRVKPGTGKLAAALAALETAASVIAAGGSGPKVTKKHSRAFTPHKNAKRRTVMVDRVPAQLHEAIMKKAKREGVSIRALVLTYLSDWAAS